MALVDHHHGGVTLGNVTMATKVQHDIILNKRFRRLISKLQREGTRNIAVMDM
jgi:hypothetical protein